jgi:hypothetical protein
LVGSIIGLCRNTANGSIEKTGREGDAEHNFHLYVRPKDDKAELWEGARSGLDAAVDVFNADKVSVSNLWKDRYANEP